MKMSTTFWRTNSYFVTRNQSRFCVRRCKRVAKTRGVSHWSQFRSVFSQQSEMLSEFLHEILGICVVWEWFDRPLYRVVAALKIANLKDKIPVFDQTRIKSRCRENCKWTALERKAKLPKHFFGKGRTLPWKGKKHEFQVTKKCLPNVRKRTSGTWNSTSACGPVHVDLVTTGLAPKHRILMHLDQAASSWRLMSYQRHSLVLWTYPHEKAIRTIV